MTFFPWSDEYSVHLRVIDNDHKDLVGIVNSLHDAIRTGRAMGEIGHIIGNLAQYVDDHFTREEALMEAYDYPGLADHKRIHRHLTRMVFAIRTVFAHNPKEIDPAKLLRFLRDWLVHHIIEEDKKYVPFLRGEAGGRSVSAPYRPGEAYKEAADHKVGGVPSNGHIAGSTETETLTLTVPADKAAVLRRCARFLAEGGVESVAIEGIVSPVSQMTLEEARHFAKPILVKRK